MHAHKMQTKLTAGVIARIIDKKDRGGSDQCDSRHGYVVGQWVEQPAQANFSSTENGEKRKNTLKMKFPGVRKPFEVTASQMVLMVQMVSKQLVQMVLKAISFKRSSMLLKIKRLYETSLRK